MNKLIVITTPSFFPDEAALLTRLFEAGMTRLHIRKPGSRREELERLLDAIPAAYYPRVALHDWLDIAAERGLGGIHLNRRNPEAPAAFAGTVSRSCHSLAEVEAYKPSCDYLFLSPIFPSISKEGYGSGFSLEELRAAHGVIDGKVIALGGIDPERIRQLSDLPFGGVAVLGALWGSAPSLDTAESIIRQYKRMAYELTR